MAILAITNENCHFPITYHGLHSARSNRNYIKRLRDLGIHNAREKGDFDGIVKIHQAADYLTGSYKDIESIELHDNGDYVECACFEFKAQSSVTINLAFSILILVQAISSQDFSAEFICGGFVYIAYLDEHERLKLRSDEFINNESTYIAEVI